MQPTKNPKEHLSGGKIRSTSRYVHGGEKTSRQNRALTREKKKEGRTRTTTTTGRKKKKEIEGPPLVSGRLQAGRVPALIGLWDGVRGGRGEGKAE